MIIFNGRRHPIMSNTHASWVISTVVWLLLCNPCRATQIAIIREPATFRRQAVITVGADSKQVGSDVSLGACKIRTCGNGFFTFAGQRDLFRDVPAFAWDPIEIAERVCHSSGDMTTYVNGVDPLIRQALTTAAEYAAAYFPNDWMNGLRGHMVADLVFVGIKDGVPLIEDLQYGLGNSPQEITLEHHSCPQECSTTSDFVLLLGISNGVDAYRSQHSEAMLGEKSEVVRRLIAAQAEVTPEYVGGDVDIAMVTETRSRWIHRKPECDQRYDETENQPLLSPVPLVGIVR